MLPFSEKVGKNALKMKNRQNSVAVPMAPGKIREKVRFGQIWGSKPLTFCDLWIASTPIFFENEIAIKLC